MKLFFLITASVFLVFGICLAFAWAMAPTPVCFETAPGVCSLVTPSNPLPTVSQ